MMNENREVEKVLEEREDKLGGLSKIFNKGGSVFYCLSALSILWGMSEIITPIFKQSNLLDEKILCIGTLNLYEIVLICVLLVLTLWKGVKDDAVSLIVISALFFTVGGILIGAIANDAIWLAVIIGIVSLILGGGKVFAIRKYAAVYIGPLLLGGTAVILFWNYLISTFMAAIHSADSVLTVGNIWRYGWLVMLAGVLLMFVQGFLSSGKEPGNPVSFINTPGMGWIFTGEILITGIIHQYVLSYIFDLPVVFGDFLPVIFIISFLIIELMRIYGKSGKADPFVVIVPFFALLIGIASGTIPAPSGALMFLWRPWVMFAAAGTWLLFLGIKRRQTVFYYCAVPYFIAFLIIAIGALTKVVTFHTINWQIPLVLLVLSIATLGFIFRKPVVLIMCAIGGPIALLSISKVELFLAENYCTQTSAAGLIMGTCLLLIYSYFKDEIPIYAGFIGALFFAIGITGFAGDIMAIRMLISVIIIMTAAILVWLKLGSKILALTLISPLLWFVYLNLKLLHGWHFVILSFMLLVVGGLISIRKGEKQQESIQG